MPHVPGERESYKLKRKYAHMKPADVAIWERFIEKRPDEYDEIIYDLAVGSGAPIDEELDDNLKRDLKILTQRKIDVVGFKNNVVDIIEVKPLAGPSAFGQVLTYRELYKPMEHAGETVRMRVITDTERPDMVKVAAKLGIEMITV